MSSAQWFCGSSNAFTPPLCTPVCHRPERCKQTPLTVQVADQRRPILSGICIQLCCKRRPVWLCCSAYKAGILCVAHDQQFSVRSSNFIVAGFYSHPRRRGWVHRVHATAAAQGRNAMAVHNHWPTGRWGNLAGASVASAPFDQGPDGMDLK